MRIFFFVVVLITLQSCATIGKKIVIHRYNKHSGELVNSFKVLDLNDSIVDFSSYKGKVIYLTFGEINCGASNWYLLKEQPKLINKYKNFDDVEFVNIIVEKDVEKWKKYIKDNDIKGNNFVYTGDRDFFGKQFKFSSANFEMVIDKKFQIQGYSLCGIGSDIAPYLALHDIPLKKGINDVFRFVNRDTRVISYLNDMEIQSIDSTYSYNSIFYEEMIKNKTQIVK